jgi:OOP family OmpA-OmpF porin
MRALAILLLSSVALAETYKVENNVLVVPREGDAAIDYVKGYLAEKAYVSTMRIEVHVDTDGKQSQRLTEQRAFAIAKALVAKGVDCKRLVPVGFGGTKPVAANDTAANKALNRRTTFAIAALRGRAIGGMPVDGGGVVAGDPCK